MNMCFFVFRKKLELMLTITGWLAFGLWISHHYADLLNVTDTKKTLTGLTCNIDDKTELLFQVCQVLR